MKSCAHEECAEMSVRNVASVSECDVVFVCVVFGSLPYLNCNLFVFFFFFSGRLTVARTAEYVLCCQVATDRWSRAAF